MDIYKTVGESVTIEFNQASGGGYLWTLKNADDSLVVSEDTIPAEGIGGNSTAKFVITPSLAGEYELTFEHKRPWEDEPEESVTMTLKVTP